MAARPERSWFCDLAWIDGRVAVDVTITATEGRIVEVTENSQPWVGAIHLSGITLPGLANTHSHVFHRALRANHQVAVDDFWVWRERMYRLVERLDPESLYTLARATYMEMALAGVTTVGEFHYLHHAAGGGAYDDPNAMGAAVLAAAADAGLRITLLDTCYLHAGLDGRPLADAQTRFSDGTAHNWAERVGLLAASDTVAVGAAIHSVRAVDPVAMRVIADWAGRNGAPLHAHVSEQPRENAECRTLTGLTPTALLAQSGVLGAGTTVVHAIHLTEDDVKALGSTGTGICLCPTTERDLADGVAPAFGLAAAGCPLTVGSDMHAVIDLFEEVRAVELDQRLLAGCRGLHQPEALLEAATSAGMRALGWDGRGLHPGAPADLIAVDLRSPRTAGGSLADAITKVVFSATAADVTDVVVAGRTVVTGGRHVGCADVGAELADAIADVLDDAHPEFVSPGRPAANRPRSCP